VETKRAEKMIINFAGPIRTKRLPFVIDPTEGWGADRNYDINFYFATTSLATCTVIRESKEGPVDVPTLVPNKSRLRINRCNFLPGQYALNFGFPEGETPTVTLFVELVAPNLPSPVRIDTAGIVRHGMTVGYPFDMPYLWPTAPRYGALITVITEDDKLVIKIKHDLTPEDGYVVNIPGPDEFGLLQYTVPGELIPRGPPGDLIRYRLEFSTPALVRGFYVTLFDVPQDIIPPGAPTPKALTFSKAHSTVTATTTTTTTPTDPTKPAPTI
jgi:hypothetical protein